jgi:hypothetical protein
MLNDYVLKNRNNLNARIILLGFFILLSPFLHPQAAIPAEYPWQLRLNKEEILVYTRRVEASPILEFKANIIVDEPLDKVVRFFEDEKNMTQWYYQCVRAELVQKESVGKKIFYFVLHLPWPVTERDCVFSQIKSINPDNGVVSYIISVLPERLLEQKGKIRVLSLNSIWRFVPLKDGRTEVYFQQHSNPGGSIPSFLINKLSVEIPFYSLKNLSKMVKDIKE